MTKKRNYEEEILAYLEEHEVNGLELRNSLRPWMHPDKLYDALISLQSAGKIKFIKTSGFDGYWKLV